MGGGGVEAFSCAGTQGGWGEERDRGETKREMETKRGRWGGGVDGRETKIEGRQRVGKEMKRQR